MLFSATHSHALSAFYELEDSYEFMYGNRLNTVAESVTQNFWQVNSQSFSMVYGSAAGKVIYNDKYVKNAPHPFDAIYLYLKHATEKSKKSNKRQKKYIIFVKRTIVADMIATRLKLYGFQVIAVHGWVTFWGF